MHKHGRILSTLVAGVSAAVALASPAQAAAPKVTVVYSSSSYLTSDFSVHGRDIAVLACTTVFVVQADGTAGSLQQPGCGRAVESGVGVAYSRNGAVVARTQTVHYLTPTQEARSTLVVAPGSPDESRVELSDLEYATNPDGDAHYGTTSTSRCVTKALGADASYSGRLDTAAPAVAAGPDGSWYVADRDANTIYRVDRDGEVAVLATLAPVTLTVSAALAAERDWPACVVGARISFEAAPTEIEVGRYGTLYVAGQPSLASGARALDSVLYAIDPTTGAVRRLPQHYAGAVDRAVGTKGRLFVARPAADRISVIQHGRSSTYLKLSQVLAVETDGSTLYAVRGPSASKARNASVVTIS